MLRSSVRSYPYADEREGLRREDVDGDGRILTMRIQDQNGAWKPSTEDPRIMRRREPDEFGGVYYSLVPEGSIRDYDGYDIKIAPAREGLDFNRNYPHMWAPEGTQGGAGAYPFSEPETRAEAEFWRAHRNINGFLTYHTSSAVILRPYSTHPDDEFAPEDLDIYKLIGEKGSQITGYECVSVYHRFRYHPKEVLHGGMDDYCYDQFGWFGFTTELWDAPTAAGVEKKDYIEWGRWHPEEDDLKLMALERREAERPGLPATGAPSSTRSLARSRSAAGDAKPSGRTRPPNTCPSSARSIAASPSRTRSCRRASASAGSTREHLDGDVYHVVTLLENRGFLPTYTSKKGLARAAARPVKVTLTLPEGATLVTGQAEQEVGHLEGRANKAFGGFGFPSPTDNQRKVEWVVRAPAGATLHLAAHAERAGAARTDITLD